MTTLRLALALAAFGLAGCSAVGVRIGSPDPSAPAEAEAAAPAPAPEAAVQAQRSAKEEAALQAALQIVASKRAAYAIGAADLLEIKVYQEADLDRTARVSPEGTITMPLIGEVQVADVSVAQAEKAIHQKLKRYIVDPHVSVFIREYGNKQVYVLGEVAKPGSYALPTEAPLTVIEAVALAGGFTQYAATNRTRVIRNNDGRNVTFVVEVTAITKRGEKSKDIRLEPNDVVFVPESFF